MKWTCHICGLSLMDIPKLEDSPRLKHLDTHNPDGGQWTEAYNRIQEAKEKAKAKSKRPE